MTKKSNNMASLKWRFDVSTFRLLGRELITDRVTAVFELVKNSYDANATRVDVEFHNTSKISGNGKIIIRDNGIGMSFVDIKTKWMVVGTKSKRTITNTAPPFNRRFVGEKGIGRFAVDKLGGQVIIRTKRAKDHSWLNVRIDWDQYEDLAKSSQLTLFTDVENPYWYEPSSLEGEQGTELIITKIRKEEHWSSDNIERLGKELTKIVSPFYPIKPPFDIYLISNEFDKFDGISPLKADALNFYSHSEEIGFNLSDIPEETYQENLFFNKETEKIEKRRRPLEIFGPIRLRLYYFNTAAKKRFNDFYKNQDDDDRRIDGIKIYRDGIITTPFAEAEPDNYKKRDILGIDKRLWRSTFDNISSREIIGILEITKKHNPEIIDATNRQDFIDNEPYRRLKDFIITQLSAFSDLKIYEREQKKQLVDIVLEKAKDDAQSFTQKINEIQEIIGEKQPDLKPIMEPLRRQAVELKKAVTKGIAQQKHERKEFLKKENMYLSLMSLQDYALQIAHAVGTSLSAVKDMAKFFKEKFPNPKYESIYKEYSQLIYSEMEKLSIIIDFMLSYARSTIDDVENFSIKKLLDNLFHKVYGFRFEKEKIKISLEVEDCVLTGHKKFFEDVITQLITNSIKALSATTKKIIHCTGSISDDHYIITFSDNGKGILPENKEKIFEIFYTTTAEQGGGGLGLWIVKTRLEALKGTIEVIEPEINPSGATFKIILPFNKT